MRHEGVTMATRATVVVAAHDEERTALVERCVRSVGAGTARPNELIVVVDGNPRLENALRERLEGLAAVVRNSGSGASSARNTGLERATGEIVAFVDDDADPDPSWLASLLEVFDEHPAVVAVGGLIVPEYESGSPILPPELLWIVGCTYRGHRTDSGPITRPIGANMAFRRSALARVGGFSPDFGPGGSRDVTRGAPTRRPLAGRGTGSNEELALSMTLRSTYGDDSLWYSPLAKVRHFVPRKRLTPGYFVHRCWVEGTTKADVTAIFGRPALGDDQRYLFRVLVPAIMAHLHALASGDRERLRAAVLLAAGAGITGAGFVAQTMRHLAGRRFCA
jgi:glycosyltransferase involved in cell wall biosynthesis